MQTLEETAGRSEQGRSAGRVLIRAAGPDEQREAADLYRAAMNQAPLTDEAWEMKQATLAPGRTLVAVDDGSWEMVGTARSVDLMVSVPGGRALPGAGVTAVGVRPDRRREGIMRALMEHQVRELAEEGLELALLFPTQSQLYGRFGYGQAVQTRSYVVDRRSARLGEWVPVGERVQMLDLDHAESVLSGMRMGLAPAMGELSRPSYLWASQWARHRSERPQTKAVCHPTGAYAVYSVDHDERRLVVWDLAYGDDPQAFADIWRYLLQLDLVDTIQVEDRPLTESVALLLTDRDAVTEERLFDDANLRLLDVEAALQGRGYADAFHVPVVLEVSDALIPENSARYAIGRGGVARTSQLPEITLDVRELAMAYLGLFSFRQLAAAGRIQYADSGALVAADALFRVNEPAWCGTSF